MIRSIVLLDYENGELLLKCRQQQVGAVTDGERKELEPAL